MFHPTEETRLLDIDGAPNTWLEELQDDLRFPLMLVNLCSPDPYARAGIRFTPVYGDATNLPFPDAIFNIAFSNSVMEHMTTLERQQAVATEALRIAKNLWIQTPAPSLPLEPHFFAPSFSFFPGVCRSAWLLLLPCGAC